MKERNSSSGAKGWLRVAFILIASLAVLSFASTFYLQSTQQADDLVIDVAGRNRMLSQRIGFLAHQVVHTDPSQREELRRVIELHDASFYALKEGTVAPGIKNGRVLPKPPSEVVPYVNQAEKIWVKFKSKAEVIVNEPDEIRDGVELIEGENCGYSSPAVLQALEFLERNGPVMLQHNDEIVKELVFVHEKRWKRFYIVLSGVFIFMILVVGFVYYLTRELNRSKEQVESYSHTLERRVRERTKKLQESYEKLKGLDKLKTQFLSFVSHELRTPLTPIRGQLQRLLSKELGKKERRESVEMILRNTIRLDKLINDVLEVSRIESKRLKLAPRKFDLKQVITEVLETMNPLAKEYNVNLKLELGPFSHELSIDQDRLKQVFINLIDNAIKHGQPKNVIVKTKKGGGSLTTQVVDDGKGIPREDIPHLFEQFYVGKEEKYIHKGAGLGLPICQGIVEGHGGKISVKSMMGQGTTFTIQLPFKTKSLYTSKK